MRPGLGAMLALGVAFAAGCAPAEPYRTALLGEFPESLDPTAVQGYASQTLVAQICGRLTTVDEFQNIEPDVAERWDISPDRTRYLFHLREGLRFRDGSTLGAADVLHSLRAGIQPDRMGQDWGQEVKAIRQVSQSEVEVILKAGNPRFLFKLSHPRMCIVNSRAPSYTVGGLIVPDSPGSYRVEAADRGRRSIILGAGGRRATVERRIVVHFRAQQDAVAMFSRGELDDLSFYLLSPSEAAEASKNGRLVEFPLYWTWFLHLNPRSRVFRDPAARGRFVAAFDREKFMKSWDSPSRDGLSLIPYGMRGHSRGKPSGRGSGAASRPPCRAPLRVVVIRGMPNEEDLSASLSRFISDAAGCRADVSFLEMGEFSIAMAAGRDDIYVDALDTNSNDPLGFYAYFLDTRLFSLYSLKGRPDRFGEAFRRLYRRPVEERNQSEYDALLDSFSRLHPGIPLGYPVFRFAFSHRVRRMHMNPLGMHMNRWAEIGR